MFSGPLEKNSNPSLHNPWTEQRHIFTEMSSEAQGTLLDLKYGDPAAAEISELKTDLEDLTQKHNQISRVMKMSLFANIVFGIICVALLSLFLFEIKEQSTNSEVSRGQDHSETSTQSDHFNVVSVQF